MSEEESDELDQSHIGQDVENEPVIDEDIGEYDLNEKVFDEDDHSESSTDTNDEHLLKNDKDTKQCNAEETDELIKNISRKHGITDEN